MNITHNTKIQLCIFPANFKPCFNVSFPKSPKFLQFKARPSSVIKCCLNSQSRNQNHEVLKTSSNKNTHEVVRISSPCTMLVQSYDNLSSIFHSAALVVALAWASKGMLLLQFKSMFSRLFDTWDNQHVSLNKGGLGFGLLSMTTYAAKQRLSPILETLASNRTFMSGFLAWGLAQVLKVFTAFAVERRWDLEMLVSSGGMPSSHASLCCGLTTSVALCHGVSDCLFPVCLGFSLIVMYDAAGVRRHAGMQAAVLNLIVEDLFKGHPVSEKKLKEILGHTPLQVFAGACLGVFVGYLCSRGCSIAS